MRSKIEPMDEVGGRTLRGKPALLLNWFHADDRTQKSYETAFYHDFGKLPEPEFTQRFF